MSVASLALGYPVFRFKLAAWVLSAVIAAVAGFLLAHLTSYASPSYAAWNVSGELIVIVMLGGIGTVMGPLVGALVLLLVEEQLASLDRALDGTIGHSHRARGVARAPGTLRCPACLVDPARTNGPRRGQTGCGVMTAALRTEGLVKRFGGLLATDHVDLTLEAGEMHALIGPNGAGKTTLVSQLCGELLPNEGRIWLGERDITRLPVDARARLGLARSYQITQFCPGFTTLENVTMAALTQTDAGQRSLRGFIDCWSPLRRQSGALARAGSLLEVVGLAALADTPARDLGHGEHRQLELAMALALEPSVLLLDEPLAGMSGAESQTMIELLQSLRGRYPILLIEHDMDAVFSLADRISVLVYGRIIASGSPSDIRENAEVREAYLGDNDLVA